MTAAVPLNGSQEDSQPAATTWREETAVTPAHSTWTLFPQYEFDEYGDRQALQVSRHDDKDRPGVVCVSLVWSDGNYSLLWLTLPEIDRLREKAVEYGAGYADGREAPIVLAPSASVSFAAVQQDTRRGEWVGGSSSPIALAVTKPAVSFGTRAERVGMHAHVSVFAGSNPGDRGLAGVLIMSPAEAEELERRVADGGELEALRAQVKQLTRERDDLQAEADRLHADARWKSPVLRRAELASAVRSDADEVAIR